MAKQRPAPQELVGEPENNAPLSAPPPTPTTRPSSSLLLMTTSASHQHCRRIMVAEAMNPDRRSNMEDVFQVLEPGTWEQSDAAVHYTFLAVYDGHGGRGMVDFLEHAMPYHVAQELACTDVPVQTRLERAFLMTDIHAKMANVHMSGATVALCLIQHNVDHNPHKVRLITANVGDARVVLGHKRQATRLTTDHKLSDAVEQQRIVRDGGVILRHRVMGVLAVARSLGDHTLKNYVIGHPDVQEHQLELCEQSPTFVIVGCDGLWDVVKDREAVKLVYQQGFEDVGEPATILVKAALKRGTSDNVTAIIAQL